MISTLKLKFGQTPSGTPEPIPLTPMTVFVGPNNSGKSRILSELDSYCRSGNENVGNLLLDGLVFKEPENPEEAILQITGDPNPGESLGSDQVVVRGGGRRNILQHSMLREFVSSPQTNHGAFCQWYLQYTVLKLDGTNRIALVSEKPAGDLQAAPANSFQTLFRDNNKRAEVRRIVAEALGKFFVLDPTNMGKLRIRLAKRPPNHELEERGLHSEAIDYQRSAEPIGSVSDGVKAFVGIVSEIVAGDPRILFIDEPEAFLHPPLAAKLGFEVSKAALGAEKRVFVSTHSSQFVMGCIQAGTPLNIVRLTYNDGVATARVLPNQDLLRLMRNPLLRSTGVLNGLFYDCVVVTESDADRAFYQEINERLLRFLPEWAIPNCLFLNAQNKQTVHTIVRPLRKLGIPAAGIVDVDVFKEGGTVWSNFTESAHIPPLVRNSLATLRKSIKSAMDATNQNMKRDGGVGILQEADRQAAEDLIAQLGTYGMFVVPGGELESWLKPLGVGGHGPSWLIAMFEKMGDDVESPDYLRPTRDDVWNFLSTIRSWLVDPRRKGIPD